MIHKFSQSSKETIQKAQAGDENAIAQVVEENMGLITKELTKWGFTPGSADFEDTVSDIKVEMINKIIPRHDFSRGAFSTFLTIAINNFLKNVMSGKRYREKQKEVSLSEPVGYETIEDTLEAPTEGQVTIAGAREHLQNWFQAEAPELEDIVLRIFDLKVEGNSNSRIVEILNEEGYAGEGKPITRAMVKNYVNNYIKSILQYFFEAFKSASLSMRKKADSSSIDKVLDELMDLPYILASAKDVREFVNDVAGKMEISHHLVNGLILGHLDKFPESFARNWINYVKDEYNMASFSKELATDVIYEAVGGKKKEPLTEEKEPELSPEISELTKIDPKTQTLLHTYTNEEIWDIASGRKTDVTEEEIEAAKYVITKGIVANRLSMRKKGKNG